MKWSWSIPFSGMINLCKADHPINTDVVLVSKIEHWGTQWIRIASTPSPAEGWESHQPQMHYPHYSGMFGKKREGVPHENFLNIVWNDEAFQHRSVIDDRHPSGKRNHRAVAMQDWQSKPVGPLGKMTTGLGDTIPTQNWGYHTKGLGSATGHCILYIHHPCHSIYKGFYFELSKPWIGYKTWGGLNQDGWRAGWPYTPPKFNSLPLKNGAWKTILSYWGPVTFQGELLNFGRVVVSSL